MQNIVRRKHVLVTRTEIKYRYSTLNWETGDKWKEGKERKKKKSANFRQKPIIKAYLWFET